MEEHFKVNGIPPLAERRLAPEVMDSPELSNADHVAALRGLRNCNVLTASTWVISKRLAAIAQEFGDRRLKVLDLATGGGDIVLGLWRHGKRHGLNLELYGCDISPVAISYAKQRAASEGADVTFFEQDIVSSGLDDRYDAIVSSHFLHHLDGNCAVQFLQKISEASNRLVLIQDLRRSVSGFVFAWLGSRLVTRSPVVHADAPQSVRAAFTMEEVRELASRAGLSNYRVTGHMPFRYVYEWERT